MAAIKIYKRLQDLKDVDPNGLPDQGVPVYETSVSSFVVQTIAAGGGPGGGSFSLGVSNLGNSLGNTGVTGTRVVLAGGNNVTLSQVTGAAGATITISGENTVAQTVQTQNRFNLTLGGNTAGALAHVSSGTLTLAGGNGVTLSQAGNAITISGNTFSQSVQPETQTFIAGISASDTLYTSGNVRFTGVGGGITVSSNTGQRVDLSVAAQSVQPGVQHLVASDATFSSGTVSISGFGDVTVNTAGSLIRISAPAQTVQTQDRFNLTLSGNTAGVMAQVSSGTMTLAGGNNITVSQNGNAITISGPNVGGAQTGISGIANSETTYTSGSVTFSELGAITIRSTTGQQFQFSVNSQTNQSLGLYAVGNTTGQSSSTTRDARSISVDGAGIVSVGYSGGTLRISATEVAQTNQSLGLYAVGNTTGQSSSTTRDARSISVDGAGIVSVGYSGGTLRISAVESNQTLGMYAVQNTTGQSSSTTMDARTLSVAGDGAVSVGYSGGSLRISAPTQTGTQFSAGVSGGNTSNHSGTVAGRLVLAGGNNITLSGSTNGSSMSVTISAPNAQTGISSIVASDTTYTSGSVQFTGSGIVTVRSSANQRVVIDASQSVQTQNLHNVTLSGNTAGAMAEISSGTLTLAGGNNITLSQNGNAVTISGGAGGGFSAGVSNVGNTVGDTGITGSRLVLAGGNGITLSQSTNASGGTVTVSGITQSVESQSIGMSNLGNTSGTTGIASGGQVRFLFAGGNNITLSQSLNGVSGTITISAPNTVAQTDQTLGLYAVGNTTGQSSSTTRDARSISVDGAGIVSVGYSGGTLRISATEVAQSVQSIGMYAVGNTTGQSSSTTRDARSISVDGAGAVSVGYSGGTLRISAPTQTTQPGVQHFVVSDTTFSSGTVSISGFGDVTVNTAANIIRISAPVQTAESQSIGMSNLGNTSGTTGIASGAQVRMLFAGAGEVTLSQSLNGASGTLTISAPVQTVESQSIGMSNVGNTSGTTGVASGGQVRFVFAGGNNITLSQSLNGASGTITISAPNLGAGAMSVGVSNLGNSAGATGITGTQLVLVGSDNITLSQTTGANGGTVSIIGPAAGGFSAGVSNAGNTAGDTGVTGTRLVLVGSGVMSLSQATAAAGATVSINAPATSSLVGVSGISISTNGSTISIMQTSGSAIMTSWAPFDESPMVTGQQGQGSLHIQPIRPPGDIQFDRIGLAGQISNATNSSNSITISHWLGVYSRNASSISLISSTSGSTNFTGSGTVGSYSLYGGPRWFTIPWTMTLSGGDYFFGWVSRTTTGGGAGHSISQLLVSKFTNSAWSGLLGAASTATAQRLLGQGIYSATTSGIPASIAFTQLSGSGSDALRMPIFMVRSGTV